MHRDRLRRHDLDRRRVDDRDARQRCFAECDAGLTGDEAATRDGDDAAGRHAGAARFDVADPGAAVHRNGAGLAHRRNCHATGPRERVDGDVRDGGLAGIAALRRHAQRRHEDRIVGHRQVVRRRHHAELHAGAAHHAHRRRIGRPAHGQAEEVAVAVERPPAAAREDGARLGDLEFQLQDAAGHRGFVHGAHFHRQGLRRRRGRQQADARGRAPQGAEGHTESIRHAVISPTLARRPVARAPGYLRNSRACGPRHPAPPPARRGSGRAGTRRARLQARRPLGRTW